MKDRRILLVVHPGRREAIAMAEQIVAHGNSDFAFAVAGEVEIEGTPPLSADQKLQGFELCLVFGGDGTILRAAEVVRGTSIPILGLNLGHVGFLAQLERPEIKVLIAALKTQKYTVDNRLLLSYAVERHQQRIHEGFALNEVVIESSNPAMIELFVQVDGRPLSRWGCDGVLIATPTGSTAYAFSAGGPVLWPDVRGMVLLPLAAHALYSRPMVISPNSSIGIDVESDEAVLSADGLRRIPLISQDRILLTSAPDEIRLAHMDDSVFTDRLVAKFKLPVDGWRGK